MRSLHFPSSKFDGVTFSVSCHSDCVWIDVLRDGSCPTGHPAYGMHARFKCNADGPYWDLTSAGPIESEKDASPAAWDRFHARVLEVMGIDLPLTMYPMACRSIGS